MNRVCMCQLLRMWIAIVYWFYSILAAIQSCHVLSSGKKYIMWANEYSSPQLCIYKRHKWKQKLCVYVRWRNALVQTKWVQVNELAQQTTPKSFPFSTLNVLAFVIIVPILCAMYHIFLSLSLSLLFLSFTFLYVLFASVHFLICFFFFLEIGFNI